MKQQDLKTLLKSTRGPFLILTPVSVFLGLATVVTTQAQIPYLNLFLLFIGALLSHVSVNTFNEYYDFRSGLDAMTIKTPFSGGSGALIANPERAQGVLSIAVISLIMTIATGLYFIVNLGMAILPLGLAGVLIIVTYTHWLNRRPLLCLIAPGLSFGPLMVLGTHLVLTGVYSTQAFFVSLVPFFLVNNLLLLNQFPDIAADKQAGRRHFPIVYGVRKSTFLYGAFVLATCGVIVSGIFTRILPGLSAVSLLPLGLAAAAFVGAKKHATDIPKLIPYLGMNVIATLLTSTLLALSIIYG